MPRKRVRLAFRIIAIECFDKAFSCTNVRHLFASKRQHNFFCGLSAEEHNGFLKNFKVFAILAYCSQDSRHTRAVFEDSSKHGGFNPMDREDFYKRSTPSEFTGRSQRRRHRPNSPIKLALKANF